MAMQRSSSVGKHPKKLNVEAVEVDFTDIATKQWEEGGRRSGRDGGGCSATPEEAAHEGGTDLGDIPPISKAKSPSPATASRVSHGDLDVAVAKAVTEEDDEDEEVDLSTILKYVKKLGKKVDKRMDEIESKVDTRLTALEAKVEGFKDIKEDIAIATSKCGQPQPADGRVQARPPVHEG